MSGDDRNKTVFRPSPLRRDGGSTPAPTPPPAGGFTGDDDWGAPSPAPAAPTPPPVGGGFEPLAGDPFAQPSAPSPSSAAATTTSSETFHDTVPAPRQPREDRNVMMAHAAPVLAMAAALQSGRWQVSMGEFHRRAKESIGQFEAAIQNVYPEGMRQRAKYALCATVDDIAQNLPGAGGGGAQWAQRNMVVTFFRENIAGDRFWDFVNEVLRDPTKNRDLIELFHACLAAGFEGRTRAMPDGFSKKQHVMSQLVGALDHVRSLSQTEVVHHWRGENAPRKPNNFWSIVGLVAAGAAGLLFLIYLIFFVTLMFTGEDANDNVAAIFPDDPVSLNRTASTLAPPPTGTEQRLRTFLADEIAQGLVTVQQNRVRTTVGTLFEPASADLVSGRAAIFDKIGQAINLEKGPVTVEGHADSDKINPTIQFPDNMALSKARANTVADIVKSKLDDPSRVTVVGLGDTVPIASNSSAEGKAENRRVEFVVEMGQ